MQEEPKPKRPYIKKNDGFWANKKTSKPTIPGERRKFRISPESRESALKMFGKTIEKCLLWGAILRIGLSFSVQQIVDKIQELAAKKSAVGRLGFGGKVTEFVLSNDEISKIYDLAGECSKKIGKTIDNTTVAHICCALAIETHTADEIREAVTKS